MDAIEAVAQRLTEASPLTGLVDDRSFPNKPKHEAALPYVTFWLAGGGDGTRLNSDRGLKQHEIRAEATADTEEQARQVMAAVAGQLHGWRERTIGVQGCFAQGDADERVDSDWHVAGQSFALWFCPQ